MSRTEIEVAADVSMRLLSERMVVIQGSQAQTVARLSGVVGVPVPALRDAWRRIDTRGYRRPEDGPVANAEPGAENAAPDPDAGGADETPAGADPSADGGAHAPPDPGGQPCPAEDQVCPGCDKLLPADAFPVANAETGARRSKCSTCISAERRNRYLSTKRLEELRRLGLAFVLQDDDDLADLVCASCGEPLEPGDLVACAVELYHADRPGCSGLPVPEGDEPARVALVEEARLDSRRYAHQRRKAGRPRRRDRPGRRR